LRDEADAVFFDEECSLPKRPELPLRKQTTDLAADDTSLRLTDAEREVVRIERSLVVTFEA
jgi:hypothetical protein